MAVVVVRLEPEERPPENENWVLVERESSGRYAASGSAIRHGRGATFCVPVPALENDLEVAIAKASAWAERHQIETVFVREGLPAPKSRNEPGATR